MIRVLACLLALLIGHACTHFFVDAWSWARVFDLTYFQAVALLVYHFVWEKK
jgi:hypothetical protein